MKIHHIIYTVIPGEDVEKEKRGLHKKCDFCLKM